MNTATPSAVARVRAWWRLREPRERMMLGVMTAMIAAFVLWYGVYQPLRGLGDAAHAQRVLARAALDAARVQADELQRMADAAARPREAEALRRAVLESAAKAGLAIDRERYNDDGVLEVEVDNTQAGPLFKWLDQMRTAHGLGPDSLSAARNGQQLRVQAAFRP